MITFRQGIDEVVTISSIDQLLAYQEGDLPTSGYQTDATIPTWDDNIGTFIYPADNWPNQESYPLGSKMVYSKTNTQINIGGHDFNISNLPTGLNRDTDTVLYYQPTPGGVKVLVTSKTWAQGTANYNFIHDVNTLSIMMYNGTTRNVYGWASLSGGHNNFTIDILPLQTSHMIDELDLINQLSELFFSKEWVIKYINTQLETVIPKAVDTAVKEAETVIQQRYVSR